MNVVVHLVFSAKLLLQTYFVSSFWYIRGESIAEIETYMTAKCSNAEFLPPFLWQTLSMANRTHY